MLALPIDPFSLLPKLPPSPSLAELETAVRTSWAVSALQAKLEEASGRLEHLKAEVEHRVEGA
jgi:hypothetical protein